MTKQLDETEPIDVLIATYNSGRYLESAIQAILRCVPVRKIIAVDRYSVDSTVSILRKYGAKIIFDSVSLGHARQLLIENSETSAVMMLDSDVVMEPGRWYKKGCDLLGSKDRKGKRIGAVVFLPSKLRTAPLQRYTNFWWRLSPTQKKEFFVTHSTLLLREALQGLDIPSQLYAAEDIYIWLQIHKNGFVSTLIDAQGTHLFSRSEDKGRWMGANLRVLQSTVGPAVFRFVILNVMLYPGMTAFAAITTRDTELLLYNMRRWWNYATGFFFYRRYRDLKRELPSV